MKSTILTPILILDIYDELETDLLQLYLNFVCSKNMISWHCKMINSLVGMPTPLDMKFAPISTPSVQKCMSFDFVLSQTSLLEVTWLPEALKFHLELNFNLH